MVIGAGSRLEVVYHTSYVVVAANEEKFQSLSILPEQQTHFQSGATLKNVLSQPANGNTAMRVRMAKAVGNHLQRGFNTGEISITQMLELSVKART